MSDAGRALSNIFREPDEASAAVAYQLDQELRATVHAMRSAWVKLAEGLYRFQKGEMWRDLGFSSFERWLEDPGLELERRWVYELIGQYDQLVVQRGVTVERLEGLHVSKVREVLPAIRRGIVTVDEGLGDAAELTRADLEQRYRGKASDGRTAGPDTSTAVRTEDEPEWKRCESCGSMIRVSPGNGTEE